MTSTVPAPEAVEALTARPVRVQKRPGLFSGSSENTTGIAQTAIDIASVGDPNCLPVSEPGIEPPAGPEFARDRRDLTVQQCECVVLTDVDASGEFDASLHIISGRDAGQAEEVATFNIADVPVSDRNLVERGAVFYVFIGVSVDKFGQLSYVWRVRFRRLPRWTAKDLARLASATDALVAEFGIDEGRRSAAR